MFNLDYFIYLLKKNKKFMILFTVVSFICLPFMTKYYRLIDSISFSIQIIFVVAMIGGYILAFVSPIYLFNFMMKKKSCNLYLSLPIKRESLFNTTLVYSLVVSIVPVLVNYLIACAMIGYHHLIFTYMGYLVFFMAVTTILTTFVLTISNNTLDSIILSGSYFAIPVCCIGCALIYFNAISESLTRGYGSYTEFITPVLYYVSIPSASVAAFAHSSINFVLLGYWFVVGVLLYIASKHLFVSRKAEHAQEQSTSVIGYPLMITAFIFSLCLSFYSYRTDVAISYSVIFMIYVLMYFFSIRKIKVTIKPVISYAIIITTCFVFAFGFSKTKGFGQVKEMMDYQNVNRWTISSITYTDDQYVEHDYNSGDPSTLDALKTLQSDLLKLEVGREGTNAITINIYDNNKLYNTTDIYRSYYYDDDQKDDVQKAFDKFNQSIQGKKVEHTINETSNAYEYEDVEIYE